MKKKLVDQILVLVKDYIDSLVLTNTGQPLPHGYNPTEVIRGALFHWVAVPFNGKDVWCQLRCLNATQLEQCGDISNLTLEKEEAVKSGKEKYTYEEQLQIRNYQEEICKMTFNVPTYDHIMTLVGADDFVISEKKTELEKIKKLVEDNKKSLTELEKETYSLQIKTLELKVGFILPTDTMNYVTWWAMGNDLSYIKSLTKQSILRAASLAKAHKKAPTDYLSGVFTDHNKSDIDSYAFILLDEHMKEHKAVEEGGKSGKFRWFRSGKNNNNNLPNRPGGN